MTPQEMIDACRRIEALLPDGWWVSVLEITRASPTAADIEYASWFSKTAAEHQAGACLRCGEITDGEWPDGCRDPLCEGGV